MKNTIVFTGGGTGGHIYPGLAIVSELKKKSSYSVVWMGSSSGMDCRIVTDAAVAFIGIPSGKLRRYISLRNIIDVFKIIAGFFAAFFYLIKLKPLFLFSKGGFVSVPPCMAARILGIPVYTHECDFSAGLATKINSRFATGLFVSYEETKRFFSARMQQKITVTGNPVRSGFYSADPEKGRAFLGLSPDKASLGLPVLVVIGGSLGARQINDLVEQNVSRLCERFIVVHQTGEKNGGQDTVLPSCNTNPLVIKNYKRYAYIREEMADVLSCADIVLSRAGANSLWECASLGRAMVLIPLCGASTRGDQVENARYFSEKGAAISFVGDEASSDQVCAALDLLCTDSLRLEKMRFCSAELGKIHAAGHICDILLQKTAEINKG